MKTSQPHTCRTCSHEMTEDEQRKFGRCIHCEVSAENRRFFVQYFQPDLAFDYAQQQPIKL